MNSQKAKSRRWEVALHEAGHLVAAEVLLKDKAGAVIVDVDGSTAGQAYIDVGNPPRSFKEALAIAAGMKAEGLAGLHDAPTLPLTPLQIVRPVAADVSRERSSHASIVASMQTGPSDDLRIAKWCCEHHPDKPEVWVSRHCWIHRAARVFVRRHAGAILDAARELYLTGMRLTRTVETLSKEGQQ